MTNSTNLHSIHWEISSACQAMCPFCTRKSAGRGLLNFKQTYTSVEQVQKTLENIDWIEQITFCGNLGDPMANPDIVDIVSFIKVNQNQCGININTNGGIGSPDKYAQLGRLGVKMIFGVDGTNGINELHRVNVKFNRVDENIRAFAKSKTKEGILMVQFIVWDQNIGNLPAVVDWCKDVGVDVINVRESNGEEIQPVTNNNGVMLHYLSKKNTDGYRDLLNTEFTSDQFQDLIDRWGKLKINQSLPPIDSISEKPIEEVITVFPKSTYESQDIMDKVPLPISAEHKIEEDKVKKFPIKCISIIRENNSVKTNLFISHDGYVFPCCFIGSAFSQLQLDKTIIPEIDKISLINKLGEIGLDKFNIHVRSLIDILNDTVLDELVFNKLDTDDKLAYCGKTCRTFDNPTMNYRLQAEKNISQQS